MGHLRTISYFLAICLLYQALCGNEGSKWIQADLDDLKEASAQNEPYAQGFLGLCYAHGDKGLDLSMDKALELARSILTSSEAKVKLRQIKSSNKIHQNGKVRVIIDNSLHQYLIELAANPYIDDFFQRHGKYYSILFKWEGGDEQAAIQAVRQHHAIIDALLKEDWEAAAKELSTHLHTNHPVLQEINSSS